MNRTTVFSHEELVCKMAANPDNLDLNLAKAIYDDMLCMIQHENQLQMDIKKEVFVMVFALLLVHVLFCSTSTQI